ncbi:MAG: HAD-IIA family hydrolase [Fibrobacter sp.]|nr:HAD-IIA family hydrolase [Fibrobacter sp.]
MRIDSLDALSLLNDKKLYVLDLDGTVYIENKLIDGALDFVRAVKQAGSEVLFLTNNSSMSTSDYVNKIKAFGFPVTDHMILTSGFAAGAYIKEHYPADCSVYIAGTEALRNEFRTMGFTICEESSQQADCVLVGFDTELTYAKLRACCKYIERGAEFIATNPDIVCPVANNRFIPDCGSICKMIQNATGAEPQFIGKPGRIMADIISKRFTVPHDKMVMIGDRLYTDIAFGINANMTSICVLTGETTPEMLHESPWKPDIVVSSIKFLNSLWKE